MTISLSEAAAKKIIALLPAKEGATGLRIKVVGGGCSGLQYKMDLDISREGDKIFEKDGAKVFVDRKSFLYLNGTEVDYSDALMHGGFHMINPHAKRTCGCGESFAI